jgi:hypothetical protein
MASKGKRVAKNRLTGLEADEVSIVPVGKNLRQFLVTKEARSEEGMDEILKQILEGDLKNEPRIDEVLKESKLSPEQQNVVKGAVRLLQSVGEALPSASELKKMLGQEEEVVANTEKTRKELLEELRKEGYQIEEPANQEEPMDQEVQKQLEKIQKEANDKIDAVSAENKSLKEELAKERDTRVMGEFKAKAESMGYRGAEAEKVAKTLKIAKEKLGDEEYTVIEAQAKSAIAKEKATELFKELGSSAGSEDGATGYEQKLEAKKAELRKEMPSASEAKLEDEALKRNPGLYKEYLDANPKQGGR